MKVDIPDPFNGKLTAKPSGKFCIPIPIAKFLKGWRENWPQIFFNGCYGNMDYTATSRCKDANCTVVVEIDKNCFEYISICWTKFNTVNYLYKDTKCSILSSLSYRICHCG